MSALGAVRGLPPRERSRGSDSKNLQTNTCLLDRRGSTFGQNALFMKSGGSGRAAQEASTDAGGIVLSVIEPSHQSALYSGILPVSSLNASALVDVITQGENR